MGRRHILGDKWPRADELLEMLEEAIELMRKLWGGEYETYRGRARGGEARRGDGLQ